MLNKLNNFLATIIAPASDKARPEHTLQLATAVLLIEVMRSDAESTDEELATVVNILGQRFHLPEAELAQLTELGHRTAETTNDFHQFTSLINRELDMPEKVRIIEYMWQVAYADKRISAHEDHLLRKIAGLFYVSHGDYIAAKMRAKPAGIE